MSNRTEATVPVALSPPFRPFQPEDASVVARLNNMASHGLVLSVWQRHVGPDGDPWAHGSKRQIERMEDDQIMVVADPGNGPEAVLMGNPILEAGDIEGMDPEWVALVELENLVVGAWYVNVLATLPEHRGKGHGAGLLRVADDIARAGGHALNSLIASDANPGALRLYERCGYAERARRPMVKGAWDGEGEEWILMTKPLA